MWFLKKTSEGSQQRNTFSGDGAIYNRLLHYKRDICHHITTMLNFEGEDNGINVGFYNNYPCIMVFIETPKSITKTKKPSTAAKEAWTQIIISYFIGLANNLAHKKGIDLELTRRSGFGFMTPTIAPCEQSFRLNVGMIPLAYADLLIECLKILNNVLKMLNAKKLNGKALNLKLPKNCFLFDQTYKDYCKEPEGNQKHQTLNILELAWEQVDKGGRTSAFNLMRSSIARDGLAAEVFNALAGKASISPNQYTQILLDALRWGFSKLTIENERLHFNQDFTIQLNLSSSIPQIQIEDQRFFSCVSFIIKSIQKRLKIDDLPIGLKNDIEKTIKNIQLLLNKKNIKNLYFYLQLLNELFYSCSIYSNTKSTEDGFGSDSEVEVEVTRRNTKTRIYGKKIIVPNGMRAIIDALHASTDYLYPDYLTTDNINKNPLFLYGSYYETALAMRTLAKFDVFTKLPDISRAKILIYDLNECIKTGKELPAIKKESLKNIEILILDSTSSTLERYQYWIEIFKKSPNMQALFFVSSGFKNEQMGADKNPYGTIRCFTKDKNLLNSLLNFIKETEKPISSAVSHDFRRLIKTLGGVPCNSVIVTPKIKKAQTARRNKVETKAVAIEPMAIDADSASNQYSETLLAQSNKHSQFFKPRNNTNSNGKNPKSVFPTSRLAKF